MTNVYRYYFRPEEYGAWSITWTSLKDRMDGPADRDEGGVNVNSDW